MKFKLKSLIVVLLFLLLFSTPCFATDNINNDLYINEKQYDIKNIIRGNVFTSVNTLKIDPNENGGIIEGNLYVTARTANIKSYVSYSNSEKDNLGNPNIIIDKSSTITGNVYVLANKFTLEPGSVIEGDLYICANEVNLGRNAKVYGNVFVTAKTLYVDCEIDKSLYANTSNFNMNYYGFINRDLHLNTKDANINGYVYRNSFIAAKKITTEKNFINQKDFTVTNSDVLTFSGEIKGNAKINAKKFVVKNKDNDNVINCKIDGNLSYSSKKEANLPENFVSGETTYNKYVNTSSKSFGKVILSVLLDVITLLILTFITYIAISKLLPKYLDRYSDISGVNLLKYMLIGLALLILTPIIIFLLFLSRIGMILGIILLLVYLALILLSRPIFIIAIAKYLKDKSSNNRKVPYYILIITIIIAISYQITYLGFIISLIVNLAGLGMLARNLFPKK